MNYYLKNMSRKNYEELLQASAGEIKADLVLKNARYLDVFTNSFKKGDIAVCHGVIAGIGQYEGKKEIYLSGKTIVPGFIDTHIHMESTTVIPSIFAKEALKHGTTAILTDPHEISNVMGVDGINYMLEATEGLPMDIFFMLPSCVPSCEFEESGAKILAKDMEQFYSDRWVSGIAEMMDVNGVVSRRKDVIDKTYSAIQNDLLIDGHAPLVSGKQLMAYAAAGVLSDHECTSAEEALDKLSKGFWIMIREGTAAQNLEAMIELCKEPYASRCMFCTDDRHIDNIMTEGHIDNIIRKAIKLGADPAAVYKMASYTAGMYFGGKERGAIAPGYLADLVVLNDINTVDIDCVYKAGIEMTQEYLDKNCGSEVSKKLVDKSHDTFHLPPVTPEKLAIGKQLPVLGLVDGQLLTTQEGTASQIDIENDILKAAVVERHKNTGHIGVGYIKGYGLKKGAIATSVAHDAHNIIAIGTSEEEIATAINELKTIGGGMLVYSDNKIQAVYPLRVAGLMGEVDAEEAKKHLEEVHKAAYENGVRHEIDPFMTLSFTALPVIPELRITTYGAFDVTRWKLY